jgi:hypothetical protein
MLRDAGAGAGADAGGLCLDKRDFKKVLGNP